MRLDGARVVVTGGAGFLGRHVCGLLGERGVRDIAIPRSATHDLTRQDVAEDYIATVRPDLVVHLAAEVGGIGANQAHPGRFCYANMAMGMHLIEAARQHGVGRFVQVGTVCSYPRDAPVPFREDALWDGYPEETNAPYGVAKKALTVLLDGYRREYGMAGITVIPVNLYGPGDNFDPASSHVIPALIRRFVEAVERGAATVEVWGTGAASREFLHVRDAAAGIVLAAEHYDDPAPVNLGTGREITIRALAEMIARQVGYGGEIRWDASRPDGQPRRRLDTTRARDAFGFKAGIRLGDGLAETIAWWRGRRPEGQPTPPAVAGGLGRQRA